MSNKLQYDENSIIALDWREAIRQNSSMYIGNTDAASNRQHLPSSISSFSSVNIQLKISYNPKSTIQKTTFLIPKIDI